MSYAALCFIAAGHRWSDRNVAKLNLQGGELI